VEAKKAKRAKKSKRLEPFDFFALFAFFASRVSSPHTRSGKVRRHQARRKNMAQAQTDGL